MTETQVTTVDNAEACQEWLRAMFVDLSPYFVLPRLRELDTALGALDPEARGMFRMLERSKLALEGHYRLSKDQLARADKLIARGRATAYGRFLQKRSIDSDAQLISLINQHARPITQEAI